MAAENIANIQVKIENEGVEENQVLADAKKVKKKPTECCAHLTKVDNFPEFFAGMASGLNLVEGICCAKDCSASAVGTCVDCPACETTFCQAHVAEHYAKGCVGDAKAVHAHATYAFYEPLGGKHKVYCAACDMWQPYSVVQKKGGLKRRNPFAEDFEHIRKMICHHAVKVEEPVVPERVVALPVADGEAGLLRYLKNAHPDMLELLVKNANPSMAARMMPFLPTQFIGRWHATISDGEERDFMVLAGEDGHRYYERTSKVTWLSAFLKYRVEVQGRHYFSGVLVKHKMAKDGPESCELFLVKKQPVEIRLSLKNKDELILRSSHMKYEDTVCHRKQMEEVKAGDLPKPQPYEYVAGNERLAADEVDLVAEIEKLPQEDKEAHLATLTPSIQGRIRPFCSPIVGTWEVSAQAMTLTFEVVVKNGFAQFIQAFPTYTVMSCLQYGCLNGIHCFIGPVTIWKEETKQATAHLDAKKNPVNLQLHLLSADTLEYSYGSAFDEMQVRVARRMPKLVPSCAASLRNTFIPSDNMSCDYVLSAVKCTVTRHPDFANEVVHAVKDYVAEKRLPDTTAHQFRLGFFD